MNIKPLIKLENVSKYYKTKTGVSEGMRKVNLELYNNEFVCITGESGAGKTTLLNVLSGLDSYEDGELYISGKETSHFSIEDWENLRATNIGFVFQNYNIIESYTVYQNVKIALEAQNYPKDKIKERSLELIEKVGLLSHKNHRTTKLSGGEKQRVVIARALAKDAPIILADEPTGNLDEQTSVEILNLLKELSKNKLVVLVTHDLNLAKRVATRNIVMSDGSVKNDFKLEEVVRKEASLLENLKSQNIFSKTLTIASRNLIQTPKRTLIQLFLSILTITAFLFLYSSIIVNNINNMTNSKDVLKTVNIINRDNSDFTIEDIVNFKTKRTNVSYDHFNSQIMDSIYNYFNPNYSNIISEKDLIDGKMPESHFDIVVYQSRYNKMYEIGSQITINNNIVKETFNVVGLTDRFIGNSYINGIYFNPKFFYDEETLIQTEYAKELLGYEFEYDTLLISATDRRDINIFKSSVNLDKYQIIDSDLIEEEEMKFVRGILLFFLWILLLGILQVIFLVTYNVQKNIMETKKTDFAVYRSIGIKEKEVALTILIEQLLIAIIATIITIIGFKLLGIFIDSFYLVNRNIGIFSYLIISVVFALFTLRQGLKFNKRIFNTTVIEALKEDF